MFENEAVQDVTNPFVFAPSFSIPSLYPSTEYTPNCRNTLDGEVSTRGTVQATLNSGGGLKDAIKEALDDLGITTAVNDISRNTKTQADKKEQTIVEIGGKTVTDAVTTQRNANGYSFQGA